MNSLTLEELLLLKSDTRKQMKDVDLMRNSYRANDTNVDYNSIYAKLSILNNSIDNVIDSLYPIG